MAYSSDLRESSDIRVDARIRIWRSTRIAVLLMGHVLAFSGTLAFVSYNKFRFAAICFGLVMFSVVQFIAFLIRMSIDAEIAEWEGEKEKRVDKKLAS
jgi:hypothetical protein